MDILAALFFEGLDLRAGPGGATHIDLTGIHFSAPCPEPPEPARVSPHLVVIVRCPADASPTAVLEVVFRLDGEHVARSAQPLVVEPGRFGYQLVRPEIDVERGTRSAIEAHCRIDQGPVTVVPYTLVGESPDARPGARSDDQPGEERTGGPVEDTGDVPDRERG